MIARSQAEIDDQINKATEDPDNPGSRWPDMTYEQGVDNALRWVTGESDDVPMEDE